jgi:hypothetical protein
VNQLALLQRQLAEVQAENERLRHLLAGKDAILHERSVPLLCAVIDALRSVARGAAAGDQAAVGILANWREATMAASASGKIVVPGNGRPA